MKLFAITLLISLFLGTLESKAHEELIFNSCISPILSTNVVSYSLSQKVRCEDLRSFQEGLTIANIAILPAGLVLKIPGVQATLGSELALLGLSISNPAVLSVTVVGSLGIATLYFILKKSLDDCNKADQNRLKQQLLNEIEAKFGLEKS